MTISSLLENAKAVQSGLQGSLVRDVLQKHGTEIVEQQKIQLLSGKNSQGEDIHPFYTEDVQPRGWFKSRESAQRYADWKQTISYPYSVKRNPNAPNLYITGVFHDDLGISFGSDAVEIIPDTAYAANIMSKYGRGMFGLSMDNWAVIFDEKGAKIDLIEAIKNLLWQ